MVFIVAIWKESRAMIINFIILFLRFVLDDSKLKEQKIELSAKLRCFHFLWALFQKKKNSRKRLRKVNVESSDKTLRQRLCLGERTHHKTLEIPIRQAKAAENQAGETLIKRNKLSNELKCTHSERDGNMNLIRTRVAKEQIKMLAKARCIRFPHLNPLLITLLPSLCQMRLPWDNQLVVHVDKNLLCWHKNRFLRNIYLVREVLHIVEKLGSSTSSILHLSLPPLSHLSNNSQTGNPEKFLEKRIRDFFNNFLWCHS